jgi:hypothetical protein
VPRVAEPVLTRHQRVEPLAELLDHDSGEFLHRHGPLAADVEAGVPSVIILN